MSVRPQTNAYLGSNSSSLGTRSRPLQARPLCCVQADAAALKLSVEEFTKYIGALNSVPNDYTQSYGSQAIQKETNRQAQLVCVARKLISDDEPGRRRGSEGSEARLVEQGSGGLRLSHVHEQEIECKYIRSRAPLWHTGTWARWPWG